MTKAQTHQTVSSLLHFKIYRILTWLDFLIHYPYHRIFHSQKPFNDDPCWATIKGSISCSCGYCYDLGMNYGMHCESCYNRVNPTEHEITGDWLPKPMEVMV